MREGIDFWVYQKVVNVKLDVSGEFIVVVQEGLVGCFCNGLGVGGIWCSEGILLFNWVMWRLVFFLGEDFLFLRVLMYFQ